MAYKFKAQEKAQPGVKGGGTHQWYAVSAEREEFGLEKLMKQIERSSTVNGADILAVLYAAVQHGADALAEGNIFRLGDFGSFRVSLESKGVATEGEVVVGIIEGAHIIFTPGEVLKAMLRNLQFQKK